MARHIYYCPLRWADMDQLGHVNNVVYVDYLQEARVDMLTVHAPAAGAEELGEGVVVVRHDVRFVAPLVFRFEPVRIETAEGRAAYVAAQRGFAERGAPLRARLVAECERLLAVAMPGSEAAPGPRERSAT